MGKRDPRVDAYIAKSADFAQPILTYLRELVHAACPDVVETMKWSMPFFEYRGNLCHMAAFKAHCGFGFWKQKEIVGDEAVEGAMGSFGAVTKLSDLPSKKTLTGYVRQAMAFNEGAGKPPRAAKAATAKSASGKPAAAKSRSLKPPPVPPADLLKAMMADKRAWKIFEGFSPTHQREYVEWVTEAKREETRLRRIEQAVAWMAEGKPRNWKHM